LAAGTIAALKEEYPEVQIIGVEPAGAASMQFSLQRNQVETLLSIDPFVDGAAVKRVGDRTFEGLGYGRILIQHVLEELYEQGHKAVTLTTADDPTLSSWYERQGFEVTYLKPGAEGIVEPGQVEAALRTGTILVSLMHVNNEIGVVQDIGSVGRLCRARGILFHVDAAQSAGKLPIDVERDCIDLLALTAHKLHGPKGVGALCMRREPRLGLLPLQFGGGQERGLRSGTLPTHQIVGMDEDEDMDDTPVLIVPPGVDAGMRPLVINLRSVLPPSGYQRVLEIVPAEESAREPARQRWLEYKQLGLELKRNEM
jgi:hypothetical protein